MDKTDSSTAMASLAAMYTESDKSDDEEKGEQEVDKISDDEADPDVNRSRPTSAVPSFLQEDDNNSVSSLKFGTDQESSSESRKRKAMKLVSYTGEDLDDDADLDADGGSDMEDRVEVIAKIGLVDYNSTMDLDSSSLSRSVLNRSSDDEIQIPPEPPGRCATHLQTKIAKLHERMRREGLSLSRAIQRKKEVRNPSIYEKLIDFCDIDEKGTNYPPEIYDPHIWNKQSYYDALDKVQKAEMEKREKERKERTKVEFVTGTKKSSDSILDDKKRKSKWDALPSQRTAASITTVTSTTSSKTTIISAVGSFMVKKSK
ncbi:SAP30-binding protein-like [Liolophura sinensis]|uniref:SAP30-binding protein-like n=1 Tax=Liolophura sinensis TaxID=3198878 RepID=UPI003159485A